LDKIHNPAGKLNGCNLGWLILAALSAFRFVPADMTGSLRPMQDFPVLRYPEPFCDNFFGFHFWHSIILFSQE
jgi:hypothetical protein